LGPIAKKIATAALKAFWTKVNEKTVSEKQREALRGVIAAAVDAVLQPATAQLSPEMQKHTLSVMEVLLEDGQLVARFTQAALQGDVEPSAILAEDYPAVETRARGQGIDFETFPIDPRATLLDLANVLKTKLLASAAQGSELHDFVSILLTKEVRDVAYDLRDGQAAIADGIKAITENLKLLERPAPALLEAAKDDGKGPHVSINRFDFSPGKVIGREREWERLDAIWRDRTCTVAGIVEWGGGGKTAMVAEWLLRLRERGYDGARWVFGWTFYDKTARRGGGSAEEFFNECLAWLGQPPVTGTSVARGSELARVLRERRAIVVLDAVEALQEPDGTLRDEGMRAFLRELAFQRGDVLCLVTTRYRLADLESMPGDGYLAYPLPPLETEHAVTLLRRDLPDGPAEEFEAAVHEYNRQPYSLQLLGSLLRTSCEGDIRKWREVIPIPRDLKGKSKALRLINAYDAALEGRLAGELLRQIGFFNGRALQDDLAVLGALALPHVSAMTATASNEEIEAALDELIEMRLLWREPDGDTITLQSHLFTRQSAAEILRTRYPESWLAGNVRLYHHLSETAPAQPETLQEMSRLYAAMQHAVRAGLLHEALEETFKARISRGNKYFSTRVLGAHSADLTALRAFFEDPWKKTVPQLDEGARAYVFYEAGFRLRALGRFADARTAMLNALTLYEGKLGDRRNAAKVAGNLAEVFVAEGKLRQGAGAGAARFGAG
jgi:hypothetical protein